MAVRPSTSISQADAKRERQRAVREIVARSPMSSQLELVRALRARGVDVTQATVSRDVAELGLVKVWRGDRHVYVAPEDLAPAPLPASDHRLRRLLADIPVTVGRSGLILVLTGSPGTANAIAQAIDQSSLSDQEGTLAGDNTLIVLFADEARLDRWLAVFRSLQEQASVDLAALPAALPSPLASSLEVPR
ncbi:MAG: arginine repressor [Chloroflexi bacterium]|nr:MAG: arginine repressor [Chloroflexota bacterium]